MPEGARRSPIRRPPRHVVRSLHPYATRPSAVCRPAVYVLLNGGIVAFGGGARKRPRVAVASAARACCCAFGRGSLSCPRRFRDARVLPRPLPGASRFPADAQDPQPAQPVQPRPRHRREEQGRSLAHGERCRLREPRFPERGRAPVPGAGRRSGGGPLPGDARGCAVRPALQFRDRGRGRRGRQETRRPLPAVGAARRGAAARGEPRAGQPVRPVRHLAGAQDLRGPLLLHHQQPRERPGLRPRFQELHGRRGRREETQGHAHRPGRRAAGRLLVGEGERGRAPGALRGGGDPRLGAGRPWLDGSADERAGGRGRRGGGRDPREARMPSASARRRCSASRP